MERCQGAGPGTGDLSDVPERSFELERVVELAHQHLDFDVVVVMERTGGKPVCRAAAGDLSAFGITLDGGWVAPSAWLEQAVDSESPQVVRGTTGDRLGRDAEAQVAAFIGVPLRFS